MSEVALRSWTPEEFNRALDAGVFGPEEKLELLDGQLITKITANPPRAACIASLNELLAPLMGPQRHIRVELPIGLSQTSQPEPDLAVVRGKTRDYASEHPSPEDVNLLVEVSDTTYRQDKVIKAALYAEAGVPELWIVDLNRNRVIVHTKPDARDYGSIIALHSSENLTPTFAPETSIPVANILP